MQNERIAALFTEIADMMDILGEDRFRVLSYRRAARALEALTEDVEDLVEAGRLATVTGVGAALAEKIKEHVRTGRIGVHEELRARFPPGVLDLLELRGIGPKKVQVLWRELGITDVETLRKAAESHRLQRVKGFGEKTEEKILRAIELRREGQARALLAEADAVARAIIEALEAHPAVERVAAAGSLRRMKETVGDIDLLALATDRPAASEAFTSLPGVREVVAAGETKATVLVATPRGRPIQVDLRILDAGSWGAGLQYFTGSKDHNIRLRTLAERRGLKLNEYGVFRGEEKIAGATEEDVYAALDLSWIPPEMREDQGEIDLARDGKLPALVRLEDIRGDFHVHTNATDGREPLEAMVAAARERGYAYVGISDHSASAAVAFGMTAERALARRDRIREINATADIRVLLGTECDILDGGAMDYPDEVLRELDFVIGSVHSRFTLPEREQTERLVAAARNPHVDILGHPTTRKLGERDPIAVDLDEVFAACAAAGTAIEVNADPYRMDLDATRARAARAAGCAIAVDTDSHASSDLAWMRFGVGTARRAWLTAGDVVNAWPLDEALGFLA